MGSTAPTGTSVRMGSTAPTGTSGTNGSTAPTGTSVQMGSTALVAAVALPRQGNLHFGFRFIINIIIYRQTPLPPSLSVTSLSLAPSTPPSTKCQRLGPHKAKSVDSPQIQHTLEVILSRYRLVQVPRHVPAKSQHKPGTDPSSGAFQNNCLIAHYNEGDALEKKEGN